MTATLLNRSVRRVLDRPDHAVSQQVGFDLVAAYVSQHVSVDFDTRAQGLAGLPDHFLPLARVIKDVPILERQGVSSQDGTHTLAPAAGWFQIRNNFWFIHNSVYLSTCHNPVNMQI